MRAYMPSYEGGANAPRDAIHVPRHTVTATMIAQPSKAFSSSAEDDVLPKVNIFTVASEWVQLREKEAELTNREAELIAEAARIKKELNDRHLFNWTDFNVVLDDETSTAGTPNKSLEAGLKLLGKFAPAPTPKMENSPPSIPPLILRRRQVAEELDAIHEAKKILGPQIRRALLDGSQRLREMIKPEYDKLQREVFSALIALGEAMLAYDRFMTGHRNMALSLLRPVIGPFQSRGLLNIGDPRDRTSPLRSFLQQAIAAGHLTEKSLPRAWLGVDLSKVKSWSDPF